MFFTCGERGGCFVTLSYRSDAGQHAHVAGKVGGLEDCLVVPPEVEADHQRLQLLSNEPGFVFHIPPVKTDKLVS